MTRHYECDAGCACHGDDVELEVTAPPETMSSLRARVEELLTELETIDAKHEGSVAALRAQLAAVTAERDAYRRAKAENDARFMNERDDARAERDAALAVVRDLAAAVARGTAFDSAGEMYTVCALCDAHTGLGDDHDASCLIARARALLGEGGGR